MALRLGTPSAYNTEDAECQSAILKSAIVNRQSVNLQSAIANLQ
jgi:hypothetical protein